MFGRKLQASIRILGALTDTRHGNQTFSYDAERKK